MEKPTLIRARNGQGTVWVEESKVLPTDEVIAQFPTDTPTTGLERMAVMMSIATRRKRKYRERGTPLELAGPALNSAEVAQHLRTRKP